MVCRILPRRVAGLPATDHTPVNAAGRDGVALKVQRGRKEIVVMIKPGDGR